MESFYEDVLYACMKYKFEALKKGKQITMIHWKHLPNASGFHLTIKTDMWWYVKIPVKSGRSNMIAFANLQTDISQK